MARDVSYAVGVRVGAWARATGASPDDVLGRLLDGPVRDYDGVDDYFRDMARLYPEAAEILAWWEQTHMRPGEGEARTADERERAADRAAFARDAERRDVRRAGDVWVVRVSPDEQAAFEAAMARSPYEGRSEFMRAGMALLTRTLIGTDPRAEARGGAA